MLNETRLFITGGQPLHGTIKASGAKNAALPILAACILAKGNYIIKNMPPLMDVTIMLKDSKGFEHLMPNFENWTKF